MHMNNTFADKLDLQHRLFAELSSMFGKEVPLYDKALQVNRTCNQAVCKLLSEKYVGLNITNEQLDRASGERHGAIRIGRPDEYRWIGRFFAAFGMEPHNFYDMTNLGGKSQPIIATAFRSTLQPEHRVFTSLLMTSYFDGATRGRIEGLLAKREVFSGVAKALIEKGEKQGGLDAHDADALIREATQRIFKWTGQARDYTLYKDLCAGGFKIAADIACFESHHLNHLTPNTLCMDLYTSAMKHCLGELDDASFTLRAKRALSRTLEASDVDWMRLHFKHFPSSELRNMAVAKVSSERAAAVVASVLSDLNSPALRLAGSGHAGFKDFTEGPSEDTPVLLRQDAYKALTEPVVFHEPDGTVVKATHTARFGEVEQRFYATTPTGRALYDSCLTLADAAREKDPTLARRDVVAYEALYAAPFRPIPKTLTALLRQGLVFGLYSPTAAGLAARGTIGETDRHRLVDMGYVAVEGVRYEDFLPVSAAGIFASNLNQYGTQSTATSKPTYTKEMLEEILGRAVIDTDIAYCAMEASSLLDTYAQLDITGLLAPQEHGVLVRAAQRDAVESFAGVAAAPGV